MGYIKHNAIIVTSYDEGYLEQAHVEAKKIFNDRLVSELVKGMINGQSSFFIAPDRMREQFTE